MPNQLCFKYIRSPFEERSYISDTQLIMRQHAYTLIARLYMRPSEPDLLKSLKNSATTPEARSQGDMRKRLEYFYEILMLFFFFSIFEISELDL